MVEHAADFEWRGEGEAAEVVLYAPDAATAEQGFEQTLPAAGLSGVVSPVYAASSSSARGFDLGWVAASETHLAPDLFSVPARGLLLVADTPMGNLGVTPVEVGDLASCNLSEVTLPRLGAAEIRRAAETGALWAAEEGLISEEDLDLFGDRAVGEPDTLPRRALSAGARDFDRYRRPEIYEVGEILDTERADVLGLTSGALVFSVEAVPEDLGRLALTAHRERILNRVWGADFGATADLPAAPQGTEEAEDLLAAARAMAKHADALAALRLYVLRRSLTVQGGLTLRAAWRLGGITQEDSLLLHRRNLAAVSKGDALLAQGFVTTGTGAMRAGAPPFSPDSEEEDVWAWEEAGLLKRVASLSSV